MRDAEDAAHNAFVELFTNWDTVRSPRAWLRTVAFRQMLRQNASAEYPLTCCASEPATVPASARLELHISAGKRRQYWTGCASFRWHSGKCSP